MSEGKQRSGAGVNVGMLLLLFVLSVDVYMPSHLPASFHSACTFLLSAATQDLEARCKLEGGMVSTLG